VNAGTVGVNRRGAGRPEREVPLDLLVAEVLEDVATKRVSSVA